MSGIGAGHNKFESCKGCPDRSVEPNCHTTCKGYLYRKQKSDATVGVRKTERQIWDAAWDGKERRKQRKKKK